MSVALVGLVATVDDKVMTGTPFTFGDKAGASINVPRIPLSLLVCVGGTLECRRSIDEALEDLLLVFGCCCELEVRDARAVVLAALDLRLPLLFLLPLPLEEEEGGVPLSLVRRGGLAERGCCSFILLLLSSSLILARKVSEKDLIFKARFSVEVRVEY